MAGEVKEYSLGGGKTYKISINQAKPDLNGIGRGELEAFVNRVITFLVYGDSNTILEDYNEGSSKLSPLSLESVTNIYPSLFVKIEDIFFTTILGKNSPKDLWRFMNTLKPVELFYFIEYNNPIRTVGGISDAEEFFFHNSLKTYEAGIIEKFNGYIFNGYFGPVRAKKIKEMKTYLNNSFDYKTVSLFGDSLYSNFYTSYFLRTLMHMEGEEVSPFTFTMSQSKSMFLYYVLKIYNFDEIKRNLHIFIEYENLHNDSYRLLYENYKTLGDDFYNTPLTWHLELL